MKLYLKEPRAKELADWQVCDGPQRVYENLSYLAQADQECFILIGCNAKNGVIKAETIFQGGLDLIFIDLRICLRRLLLWGAVKAIIAHNHPSGDPEPSDDDIRLTRTLYGICDLCGIVPEDHIVIGDGRKYSFMENGIDFKKKIKI